VVVDGVFLLVELEVLEVGGQQMLVVLELLILEVVAEVQVVGQVLAAPA